MSGIIDTLGWDTVFAIRVTDVNAELRKPGVSPSAFSATVPQVCTAQGTFGPWQIAVGDNGGDGTLLRLTIPVPAATLNFQNQDYDASGGTALVELALDFVPQAGVTLPSGTRQALVAKQNGATVREYLHPNSLVSALMVDALGIWFNANLADFAYVFATCDLNVALAQAHLQWLAPTHTAYAYHNGSSDEDSYLGILSMTSGHSAAGISPQLAGGVIPDGQRAGFLMSQALFLQNIVLPSLPAAFPGSSIASFRLDPETLAIVNAGDIAMATVRHAGIDYHPVLEAFSLSIEAGHFLVRSQTRTEISPGITAYAKQSSHQSLVLAVKPDGSQTLQLVADGNPQTAHWWKASEGVQITEYLLAVIGIIVEIVLAALTAGASLVVSMIIAALLVGVAAATPELIGAISSGQVNNDMPSVSSLVLGATSAIRWQGSQQFQLGSVLLADAFQMGGDPVFLHLPTSSEKEIANVHSR